MAQTVKSNSNALPCFKNIEALHATRFEYFEQLSPLDQLQIPNRIHVINFGAGSNLNLLWILKGYKPFGTNMRNSPKFSLDLIFTKVNLFWHTYMQEFWVTTQVSNDLVWIKQKSLNLKFKPQNIYNTNQTCKDFIQASKIHSKLWFKPCSYYSGTRGAQEQILMEDLGASEDLSYQEYPIKILETSERVTRNKKIKMWRCNGVTISRKKLLRRGKKGWR
jgi:hypothetical protein